MGVSTVVSTDIQHTKGENTLVGTDLNHALLGLGVDPLGGLGAAEAAAGGDGDEGSHCDG